MTEPTPSCGAPGGCVFRPESSVEAWADAWDVRPLIDARLRKAAADALRDAATATLEMNYPASADPDIWGAWLLERAGRIEADRG